MGDEYDSSYKSKLIKREEDNIEIVDTIFNDRKNVSRNYMTSTMATVATMTDERLSEVIIFYLSN